MDCDVNWKYENLVDSGVWLGRKYALLILDLKLVFRWMGYIGIRCGNL